MDDNDDDDYENNERLNKIPTLDRHQFYFSTFFSVAFSNWHFYRFNRLVHVICYDIFGRYFGMNLQYFEIKYQKHWFATTLSKILMGNI